MKFTELCHSSAGVGQQNTCCDGGDVPTCLAAAYDVGGGEASGVEGEQATNSVAERRDNKANVSGKFGGVAGVFAGVHILKYKAYNNTVNISIAICSILNLINLTNVHDHMKFYSTEYLQFGCPPLQLRQV